jgi:hypothetical protein
MYAHMFSPATINHKASYPELRINVFEKNKPAGSELNKINKYFLHLKLQVIPRILNSQNILDLIKSI